MPITIKSTGMKYKNPDTGVYQGVDMLEEATIRDVIVDVYSPTSPYSVGEYCLYNGELYCCTTAIPAGGEAWNSAHWEKTNVTDELEDIKGAVDSIGSDDVANESNVTGTTTTAALNTLNGAITSVEKGLAIIVTGDTCSTAVPSGGYAYIKNNTHGLTEGLYRNKTASAFPTSGGTANSTVFEAVPNGGLNDITNSGAGYFRTADGTQICWGDFSATISDFSPYGTYYQGAGNPNEMFAQPFISAPNVVVTPYTNVWHTVLQVACNYEEFTNITVERQNNNTVTISDHYIAIGRWK